MRTILIPTDFTSVPLLLLKHAATSMNEELDVIFMYSTTLSDSITDLLFYSPKKIIAKVISQDFSEGCIIMQNRYPDKIQSIRYEVFTSAHANSFAMLAQANNVDEVLLPMDYNFHLKHLAFDPTRYIIRSGVPVLEVDLRLPVRISEHDLIASLMTN
ncbi:MAG: hypothetical protein KF763_20285 [Cyclobacteriaceae bacterium]|nr:hypothetical protein [Cyclobacteriaceae bacterium]